MIRVLLVEDSVTQREILRRLIAGDGDFAVVAEARNGKEALAAVARHAPDVVLMDIHMPDMDGITATREIMRQCPVPIVIASATLKKDDVDLAMQAFQSGAVAVIEKPEGAVLLHLQKIGPALRRELIAASQARLRRAAPPGPAAPKSTPVPARRLPQVEVVGVCVSTGGPTVLMAIFSRLPPAFPIPVLLVQHITQGFEAGFARWLAGATGQAIGLATPGQRLLPGIWIAPAGRHLTLGSAGRIELPMGKPADIHCPSGDPLFESLARHAGPRALGVQLTGMGDDGAHGLLKLKQAGAMTIIQDEPSCLIWGMPRAAQECGAATCAMSPEEIGRALAQLAAPRAP